MKEFIIETDIPLPPRGQNILPIPLNKLEVGQSVLADWDCDLAEQTTRNITTRANKMYAPKHFEAHKMKEGVRIWRTK